ncbi:MAG TPA: hypothetical protein VFK85_09320 [Anaeromyxobacteraceae bacterium]|nr:hypothetical protein [Anaeromyxobacteraceae bacterium]
MPVAAASEWVRNFDRQAPTARVTALGGTRYALQLGGALSPGWTGSLARELAARRISIVRGWARRSEGARWEAQLLLELLDARVNPFHIDFLALARTSSAPRRLDLGPRLQAYQLDRTDDAVELAIRAADGVGLLDALLASFAFYSLFPVEMTIETRGGVAHDFFRLQRTGGGPPSDVVVAALEGTLVDLAEPC